MGKKNYTPFITGTIFILVIGGIIALALIFIKEPEEEEKVYSAEEECHRFTEALKPYIEKEDYAGFDNAWFDHGDLTTSECETIDCACPSAWDLFLENKKLQALNYLDQGLVSSAYNILGSNYIDSYEKLRKVFDENNIFKILSTDQKEDITGVYASFGSWEWKYEVGGSFSFNKQFVNYGSSTLSLQFDDYSDKVLISGHIASTKHPNWNKEANISVNWYNYKIIDNIIYIKLENESESSYDGIFQIISLTDSELQLKLLFNTTDVNAGQIYKLTYLRK